MATAKQRPHPVPTLGALHRAPGWFRAVCRACGKERAIALAPFVIRWGQDASSDLLRDRLRCAACGARGASIYHPSWADVTTGFEAFPG